MKSNIKYLLIALVAAVGCTSKSNTKNIEKQIEAKADTCKDTSKCIVNVKELTDFEWEGMYVFNYAQPKDVIEQAIGTSFPGYEEGMRPMIFMNKGQIAYYENNPDGLAKGSPGQIIFNYTIGLKYWVFVPTKVNFMVKREKAKGKTFYELFEK